jgi:diacylglycerol kinase (ATP)
MRTIQIVVTPGSGNGRALARAKALADALRARGHRTKLDVFPDLVALRRWASAPPVPLSLIVCVGGDGTLDTVAAAAVTRSAPLLAVGSGFGNLFARALGQPTRVERAVALIERGELVHVDVGLRNGNTFLCQESFGLLDQIQQTTEAIPTSRVRWRRSLAYYQTALRHLRAAALPSLRVAVDGRVIATDAVIVTVANVETYGPWLPLTPDASPTDGVLDVFVMRGRLRREIVARLLKRQLRLDANDAGAFVRRGRRISVLAPRRRPQELRVLPRRLPVIVSSETARELARSIAPVPVSGRRVA